MDPLILAPWRDLALIYFVIIGIIVALIPGALFYFAIKGIRAVKRFIRTPLLQAQVWALRIQHGTLHVTDAIVSVPIQASSKTVQVTVTTRNLIDFVLGR